MTKYHEWKRRLWGPNYYPIENGPPYRDPATGAPMLPGGIQGGPYQGIDDDGPNGPGNPVTLTLTGTTTGPGTIVLLIKDETVSAPDGGRWVGASWSFEGAGDTAADLVNFLALAWDSANWSGWLPASTTVSPATITLTPQGAGTATGWIIYEPYDPDVGAQNLPGPIQPPAVVDVQVDLSNDPNIIAGFPQGPLNGTADWGDGTMETFTSQMAISHTYDSNGTFTLTVTSPGYETSYTPILVQGN